MTATIASTKQTKAPSRWAGIWNSSVTTYYLIIGAAGLLVALGLIMVLSSSTVRSLQATGGETPFRYATTQAIYAALGILIAVIASRLPIRMFRLLAWPVLGVGVALQALVVFTSYGAISGGNRNWFEFAGIRLQPSEFIKVGLVLFLGHTLARKRHQLSRWLHVLFPGVIVAGGAVGLVLVGHDLGTALVIMLLIAGALFVAGIPMRMVAAAGVVAALGVVYLAQTSESRMERLLSFFTGTADPQGSGYQSKHGIVALGSGGLFGEGLGASREKWLYLPEAHNDFIFAIIGEELGLAGTLTVLILFTVLALAMTRLIRRSTDPFVQIATGAAMAWIIGQALINMIVVVGGPVIGLPLPLVSYGGSALIVTLAAIGMLAAFARNEPGAREAFAARGSVVRRSLAVVAAPQKR